MTFLPSSSTRRPNSPLPVVLWLKGRAFKTMGETQSLQLALLVFTITWIYY